MLNTIIVLVVSTVVSIQVYAGREFNDAHGHRVVISQTVIVTLHR